MVDICVAVGICCESGNVIDGASVLTGLNRGLTDSFSHLRVVLARIYGRRITKSHGIFGENIVIGDEFMLEFQ